MSLFQRLAGSVAAFFQIGGPAGPGLNANGAALEARNAANNAFAVMRGATPVAANDLVTLASLEGGLPGEVQCVRFALGTGAAQASVTGIPAGAIVLRAEIDVTVPYSGGTTITVGSSGTATLLMAAGDSTATVAGLYDAPQDTAWDVAGSTVRVAVAGAPVAGAGFCVVTYSIPQA